MIEDGALIGRREELELAVATLTASPGGHVVLAGAAGVGKTRLAAAIREALASAGWQVVHAVATRASATVSFGAVPDLVPDHVATLGIGRAEEGRLAAFQGALRTLASLGTGSPGAILSIDDAHLLDEATAALVHRAALTATCSVLVTIRAGEHTHDAVRALWKDGLATRVELQALSRDAMSEQADAILDGHLDDRAADRLWELTGGNPLFVQATIESSRRTGSLRPTGNLWTWVDAVRSDTRLDEVMAASVGELEGGVADLVEWLAAADRLPVEIIEALTSAAALLEADQRRIVTIDRDIVAFSHPLYGEVVRAGMSGIDLRARRAQLAGFDSAPAADPLLRATWLLEGGAVPQRALFLDAARLANDRSDHVLAERLGLAVLDASSDEIDPEVIEAVVVARLGRGDAVGAASLAASARDATMTEEQRARLGLQHQRALFWGLSDVEGALDALEHWARPLHTPAWRDLLTATRATVLASSGSYDEAETLALELLEPGHDPRARVTAFGAVGTVLLMRGDATTAIDLAAELLPTALEVSREVPGAPIGVLWIHVTALALDGRLDEIDRLIDLVAAVYTTADDEARALMGATRGAVALLRGQMVDAAHLLDEAISLLEAAGRPWRTCSLATVRAEALAVLGDGAGARASYDLAQRLLRSNEMFLTSAVQRAESWVLYAERGVVPARAASLRLASQLRPEAGGRVTILDDALRFGAGRGAASAIVASPAAARSRLGSMFAARAQAILDRDGRALEGVSIDYASIGMVLHAAETAAFAAEAYRGAGDVAGAARMSERARVVLRQCQGVRSPVVDLRTGVGADALTPREREIATLAGAGMANADIAEQLFVAVRTVEGHLARTYAKLGVKRREDLAGIFAGSPEQNA